MCLKICSQLDSDFYNGYNAHIIQAMKMAEIYKRLDEDFFQYLIITDM